MIQFQVLLPSFFPWWLRHGSMDPSEGTFPKVNSDWNSRPFGYAPFAMSRCSCCLCDPRASPLLLKKCRSELRTTRNLLLSLMLKPCNMTRGILKATGISSSCRYGLFGIWWGQTFCASEIEQPFNAHVVWPTTVPSRSSNARLFRFELNPIKCFLFCIPLHQLVPHLVPNYPPCPSVMCRGVEVCSVLVKSVSPRRLVLEVRLFPSPPCAVLSVGPSLVSTFFFLLPFRVYPASARVCVCVCACNIWADVKLLLLQGAHGHLYGMGQRRPIQVAVQTCLQFYFPIDMARG